MWKQTNWFNDASTGASKMDSTKGPPPTIFLKSYEKTESEIRSEWYLNQDMNPALLGRKKGSDHYTRWLACLCLEGVPWKNPELVH